MESGKTHLRFAFSSNGLIFRVPNPSLREYDINNYGKLMVATSVATIVQRIS